MCLAHIHSMGHVSKCIYHLYIVCISPMCMKHIYIAYIYIHTRASSKPLLASHHLAELLADVTLRVLHTPFGPEEFLHCSKMALSPLLPRQDPH